MPTTPNAISPYFMASPLLRRSRRKTTAAAAATLVTAMTSTGYLPTTAEGFVATPRRTPNSVARVVTTEAKAAKRKMETNNANSITPSPPNKKRASQSDPQSIPPCTPNRRQAAPGSTDPVAFRTVTPSPTSQKKWSLDSIVDHKLNSTSRTYSVKVQWSTGEETWEPLGIIAQDEPGTCAEYAEREDLLEVPGWKRFKKHVTVSTTKSDFQVKKKSAASPKKRPSVAVTQSFEPQWSKQFITSNDNGDANNLVPVHTLILGTHPSIKSLEHEQYYGHTMNAFWWIAGDCLGFRRASGVSDSTGKPYKFASSLRFGPEDIIPYPKQMEKLTTSGFALWDVVQSCQRPGSLDQDISKESPNAIREFCQQHKGTLRRIVFASGQSTCELFLKHFRDWAESGELQYLSGHEASEKAFAKAIARGDAKRAKRQPKSHGDRKNTEDKITLVAALSVSPAAARYTYQEKRDFWDEHVYGPGLEDFHANNQQY